MSGVPPRLDTGTLAAGGALSPGTSMPKLDSPFVDEDRTTDVPWYLLIVNLRKLTQPQKDLVPGTYLGFTINAYGQITAVTPGPITINSPIINNPTVNGGTLSNMTLNNGVWNNATINNVTINGTATAPTVATADNSTRLATTAYVKNQGYITDAPVDGLRYARQNGVWVPF